MKRKAPSKPQLVIDPAILAKAKLAIESERIKPITNCVVCSSPCAPNSTEGLCWVCRRLKISAWRESDSQPASQE